MVAHHRMHRWVVAAVAAALVLALFAGTALAASEVTLKFWSWRTEDVQQYAKFIEAFRAKHPDIDVQFIPYKNTEYNTILATALQGGAGPDVAHLRAYGGLEPLANAGYLVPLDGKVEGLKRFPSDLLAGARNRRDGHVYGVPFAVQTVQILYNKRIFRELGLREPQTWDEFLALAGKVNNSGRIAFSNGSKEGWTMETFFGAVAPNFYGGTPFYNELVSGKATFEDPRFINALRKMLEVKPYLPQGFQGIGYTDMQAMFAQEMAAMWMAGSYELGTMRTMNPKIEIGVFPVPRRSLASGSGSAPTWTV
ncbi:MAG: extracellular solute-binding protein [Limnochordaceae bacterium]|nr:extracellular solute-binding protein [Limnochordaceae bacterium]